MENLSENKTAINTEQTNSQAVHEEKNLNNKMSYEEVESDLNSKILEVTMSIKAHYPELSKYLEEMPVTIPDEKNPEITLKNLSSYYESLNSILNKYKSAHHNMAK